VRGSSVLTIAIATGLLLVGSVARAQPSTSEQLLSQALFDEARQLMDRGNYAAACPKLAESQRLDPGGGTLLNLAICHEKEGRLGTAYLEMSAAATQAAKDNRKDREKIANERLAVLTAKAPRLAIHVVQEEPNIEVQVDGTVVRKPAWDLYTVVDPGSHVVDASAPGKARFRTTIALGEGEKRTVEIPALRIGTGPTETTPDAPSRNAPAVMKTNPWFIGSIVTAVAGLTIGATTGTIWGTSVIFDSTCEPRISSGFLCMSDGVRNTWLGVTIASLVVGAVGTVGIFVFPNKVRVQPSASSTSGGAVVVGTF
jgi:hypothetical protein